MKELTLINEVMTINPGKMKPIPVVIKLKYGLILILLTLFMTQMTANDKKQVLVYTFAGDGYVHENIAKSAEAIIKLASENNFDVVHRNNPDVFSEDSLKKFDAIVFSNTNEEAFLTNDQRLAFKRYIQAGGAFVGIHGASTSEAHWPWFVSMVGGTFVRHPKFQEYTLEVIDKTDPSTKHIPDRWVWSDECYFMDHLNPAMHVLMVADLTTVQDDKKEEFPGTIFGDYFPAAWYQYYDGGKQWYTALGHAPDSYDDPVFLKHILQGILWAIKDTKLDYSKATATQVVVGKKIPYGN